MSDETFNFRVPANWVLTTIGNIVKPSRAKTLPSSCPKFNFIGMEHVAASSMKLVGMGKASDMKSSAAHFRPNDVLYGRLRPYLNKVFKPDFEGLCSSEFIVLTPPSGLYPKFLQYLLNSARFVSFASHLDEGDRPRVKFDQLEVFELGFPPHTEQVRIVEKIEELFSELEKSIESLQLAQVQLKAYRKSLLKSAFEGKLTELWRRNNKEKLLSSSESKKFIENIRSEISSAIRSRQVKLFNVVQLKQEEVLIDLVDLPHGWSWIHVGHISTGPSYGTSAKSSKEGKCPVLRMGNIQNCEFDWTDLVYTSDKEEIKKYRLTKGDVLFNRTNSPELVGKTAIFESDRDSIFAGYLVRLNHIQELVDSHYLNFFLNSPLARQYGNKVKTDGVNQSNINAEKLSFYPFPYCSLDEQKEVSRILSLKMSEINKLDEILNVELRRAENLRQSILKQAFEGKLVPQDPNDEPASLLLERLKAELHCINGNGASQKTRKGKKKK